jgi:hypothetical protein
MLLQVKYNPIALLTDILTVLTFYYNTLSEIDVAKTYEQTGYITNDYYYRSNILKLTWDQANTLCSSARMDLLTPTKDMRLGDMFSHFNTNSCWTQIYESKVTQTLVNMDQYPPAKITNDSSIKMPTEHVPEHHGIALTIDENNSTSFEPVAKTEQKTTVCMAEIAYPRKEKNVKQIVGLKSMLLSHIQESRYRVEQMKSKIKRKLLVVQSIGNLTVLKGEVALNETVLIDADMPISKKISDELNQMIVPLSQKMLSIASVEDFSLIVGTDCGFHDLLRGLLQQVLDPLDSPIKTLPCERRDQVTGNFEENISPKMALSENQAANYLFVHFLEKYVNDSLPLKFLKNTNFSTFDTDWNGFYHITLPDVVLGIFWVLQGLVIVGPFVASIISDMIYKRQIIKLRKRGRRNSLSQGYQIKKLVAKPTWNVRQGRPGKSPKKTSGMQRESMEIELAPIRKKGKAPPPPTAPVAPPPSAPYYKYVKVRVTNDDMPMHEGDSLIRY